MREFSQNRFFIIVFLFAALALTGCDLFNNDDETPTSPLSGNVVLIGQATVQAGANGIAEYLGQVTNTGSVTARTIVVSVNIFDGNNALIDVASTSAVPADLGPNETGTFKITSTTQMAAAISFQIVIEWD